MIDGRSAAVLFLCAALLCLDGAPAKAGVSGPLASADQNWWACEVRSVKPDALYACSGVLVGPRTILTAKHCLSDAPISSMSVWCGGSWVNGPTSWVYPDTSTALDSDIALITVSQNFWYSSQYAPRLPDSTKTSDAILKSGNCTTWGFGEGPDGQMEYLRWQRVSDINKGISPGWMSNSPSVIAHGDSGGPVVCVTGDAKDYTTAEKTIIAINTAFATDEGKDWMLRVDPFRAWICAALSGGGACLPRPAPSPTATAVESVDPDKVFNEF